jgi:putative phosphoesterase
LKTIGVLSDTHGFIHPSTQDFFKDCDEIWHAGDVGNIEVIGKLKGISKVVAVPGNIDDQTIRNLFPEIQVFELELKKILITHIGGYPGKYAKGIRELLLKFKPDIFACGHSHILRIMYDHSNNLLFVNPGAAGRIGIHQKITLLRFKLHQGNISDMEIFETDRSEKQ